MTSLQLATVADALGVIDEGARMVIAGEVAQVLGIAAVCDLHRVDESALVEGAERWVAGGADGTPQIGEFLAGEVGIVLGVSPASAIGRIAAVLNVRHRHPALWAAVTAGEVRFHEAARVADACVVAGLDQAAALWVDAQCAVALRMQPWTRVRSQVDRWILLADPAAAAERAEKEAAHRAVHVGQIAEGHCDLWGRLDAADGVVLDQALTSIAKTLPTDTSFDARRATAIGMLARNALGQAELPRAADLIIRVDATQPDGAEIDGWGSLLTGRLGAVLAGCRVTVRPIVDAQALTASDAYQVPPSMRRVLDERWGVDAFPHGSRPARSCQADHTRPFDPDAPTGHGQTHPDLMAPLSSFTHRMKTHAGYRCEQPAPGVLVWTTPHGWRLVTTPAGTIRIHRPPPAEHAWWHVEPPDDVDDHPDPGCPILQRAPRDRAGARTCGLTVPPAPEPAQPPLALAYFLTA